MRSVQAVRRVLLVAVTLVLVVQSVPASAVTKQVAPSFSSQHVKAERCRKVDSTCVHTTDVNLTNGAVDVAVVSRGNPIECGEPFPNQPPPKNAMLQPPPGTNCPWDGDYSWVGARAVHHLDAPATSITYTLRFSQVHAAMYSIGPGVVSERQGFIHYALGARHNGTGPGCGHSIAKSVLKPRPAVIGPLGIVVLDGVPNAAVAAEETLSLVMSCPAGFPSGDITVDFEVLAVVSQSTIPAQAAAFRSTGTTITARVT